MVKDYIGTPWRKSFWERQDPHADSEQVLLAKDEAWCDPIYGACQVYQVSKGTVINTRLYTPLSILNHPWEEVNMEFVLGLLVTQRRCDLVLVIVDWFSKMTHLIACHKTLNASNFARLFFKKIVHLHGVSKAITSNQDKKFMSHFWRNLWKRLGTSL